MPLHSTDKWIEVRSPNFRVLSNGSPGSVRRIAREFEQMRALFASQFPTYRLESGAPLIILAPRDEASFKFFASPYWKGNLPAGFFQHGWEKQYAVVRLDADKPGALQVVYHEYVHHLLHTNVRLLPVWLDEGLAEFYGNTRFEQSQLYLGAPNPRMAVLQQRPPFSLEKILEANSRSSYYRDGDKVQVFYAESWALVHYLMFGPGMDGGKRLAQFNRLVQQGVDPKVAFQQAIGDPKEIEKGFFQYMRQLALPAAVIKTPPQINEKDFTVRQMSDAESSAELGGYMLWARRVSDARPLLEQALKEDPKLGVAHENIGFLYFADGKDSDAVREFTAALDLDPTRYLSLFFKTMLSSAAPSEVAADQAALRAALTQVLQLNPQFAPAYVELAKLDVRQGQLTDALTAARRAEQLEPSRAGYHILSGRILLLMGHGAQAAESAQFVADRWYGPDRYEALALWNDVPSTQRSATVPAPILIDGKDPDADFSQMPVVDGRVKSVACGDKEKKQEFNVVLDQGGKTLTFRVKQGWRSGFSDTFWWGEDHYSLCHHVEALHAVVRYKPVSDSSYCGDLEEIELRDDLPAPPTIPTSAPVGTAGADKPGSRQP
jgi:Tfp pilus assembly protein PilF